MGEKLKYTADLDALTAAEHQLLDDLTIDIRAFVRKSPSISKVSYKTRDAHATTYSILEGKFAVDPDFEDQHLFPKKIMDAVLRISNAHLKIIKGNGIPAYGFSIKISDAGTTTANFPLVNFPLFPFNSVAGFLKLFTALNRYYTGNLLQKTYNIAKILFGVTRVIPNVLHRSFVKNIIGLLKKRKDPILSFDYHSIGVYRFGTHLVKLKLVPHDRHPSNNLSIEGYMKNNGHFIAQLYVQYAYNLANQPVNELHREWKDSPFVPVGKFIFTQIADKNAMEQELLSFNPFDNNESFKPVGRIQQLRDKAYKASLEERSK